MNRLLVVNADDYGLTIGVSRAILRAHREGIVTSTSVLALGSGFDKTVGWLADVPSLGTGAHLAVVGEDPPLLARSEIPTLVDRRGRLPLSWRQLFARVAAGRIDVDDIRRELTAQLERIVAAGVEVDHLDTHQNVHLWPAIREVVFDLGDEHGVRAIRVTRSNGRGPVERVVRKLSLDLQREATRRGWAFPIASTGLDEAGHLDLPDMVAALARLARQGPASAELATHPGERGDADLVRYRWGYSWGEELDALCSGAVRSLVGELGFTLGRFSDLAPRRAA